MSDSLESDLKEFDALARRIPGWKIETEIHLDRRLPPGTSISQRRSGDVPQPPPSPRCHPVGDCEVGNQGKQ